MDLLVVIPTYDERENVRPISEAIFRVAPETDILFVDDNSPDGTGPSLELINPYLANQYALSWEASSGADGTPGQANSIFNPAPPPVIADVHHDPPIPAGGAPVTITARVFDANPIGAPSARVCWRQDAEPTVGYTCVSMLDEGLSGDGAAGDDAGCGDPGRRPVSTDSPPV